jgi:3'(2'), 5'-bisphosphate nucleotidase
MGVIYVPVTATLYFGSESSGAYRLEGINSFESMDSIYSTAVRLPEKREDGKFTVICSRSHLTGETEDYIRQMEALHGEIVLTSKGSSLKLCLIAEGRADSYPRYAPTMEWDTAAGQAIVEASGGVVLKTKTTEPLRYNKEDLLNPWFVASR